MKQKRPHGILLLLLGLALAVVHGADLLLWADASTGFARSGSVWWRYAVWLAALLLPYLPARRAAPQPAALSDTNLPLGICMVFAGVLLAASGLVTFPSAWVVTQNPYLFTVYPLPAAWADVVTPLLGGVWLVVYGVRACLGFGLRRGHLGHALAGVVLPLCLLWRLVWRFQFVPASLQRMPCTLRVLSAVAALLFAVVLLKVFLVPGLPCGHTLFAAGSGCFLLCTCLELVQTLFEAFRGMLILPDLLTGLGIGLLGLCGLVCAWAACGPDAAEEE
ncbi:hypothetical protein [Subdoligranulum variabile]|uniref:Uncharacterized protein n=1 Tax=Subdoligranulum variabile DSM 15176 TaxID=411471 RepID=D1PP95_9FIRM|nr:hypothetical protein [Subdoligranulum variabile]EFB75591.1 hypothetical protein SUBVAR_06209 [Subdoligranulum variabile DSM 15176]UWP69034.1 hypothetical protein NQ490_04050 [Subdoligranulum variabile]